MRYSAVIRSDDEPASQIADLPVIPGDTYAVKAELKVLGALWDKAERIWRIAPEKLAQARALVENQTLIPQEATGESGTDLEKLADPFETDGNGPRYATLSEQDGNLYAAKDALKAIGAKWDKNDRAWKVREERADYARAIIASVTDDGGDAPTKRAAPRPKRAETHEDSEAKAVPAEAKSDAPAPAEKQAPPKTAPEAAVLVNDATVPEAPAVPSVPVSPIAGGMPLGGLWRRRGPDGKVFLVGYLSDTVEIRIVGNEQKADENDPSHLMVLFTVPPAE